MAKALTIWGLSIAAIVTASAPSPLAAQDQPSSAMQGGTPPSEPRYQPPPRGVPGGRVGGASRGTGSAANLLPIIDLLAPDGHVGLTTNTAPILYFFVSQPISWPTQFTISKSTQAKPIVEADITAPRAAGIYSVRVSDYHVQLESGVIYTWSVSVILDPNSRSRDIVASAMLLRTRPDPALETTLRNVSTGHRAALLAKAGIWYDAVAAAAEAAPLDRHAALDALTGQVGLVEAARYDRQAATAGRSQ